MNIEASNITVNYKAAANYLDKAAANYLDRSKYIPTETLVGPLPAKSEPATPRQWLSRRISEVVELGRLHGSKESDTKHYWTGGFITSGTT